MSEILASPEELKMTEAQVSALSNLCERYGVEFSQDHYIVNPPDASMMAGWAEGWLGGPTHTNSIYQPPEEPQGKPTIYVGCSPEGQIHS